VREYRHSFVSYELKDGGGESIQEMLEKWGKAGWRLVSTNQHRVGVNGHIAEHYFYWEREVKPEPGRAKKPEDLRVLQPPEYISPQASNQTPF
jgi:hypothetical protein